MDDTAAGFARSWSNWLEAEKDVQEAKGKKAMSALLEVVFVLMMASARSRRYLTQLPKSRAHY
jgi:hypothetical protein